MKLYFHLFLFVTLYCASYVFCGEDKTITFARIESCPGCSLNRLPEVKKFIFEDVPKYKNVEFKRIHGAIPELVLLNSLDEEVERLQLSRLNRQECNDLLVSKGFKIDESSQNHNEF